MIRDLPACEKGVLHFSIMTLSSLGLLITVSILEGTKENVLEYKDEKHSDTKLGSAKVQEVVTLQKSVFLLRRGPHPLCGSALVIDKEGSSQVVLPLLPARGQSG